MLRKQLSRGRSSEFVVQLPACSIELEASGGRHHWSRVFKSHGHTVRTMAPRLAKPFGCGSFEPRFKLLP